MPPITGYVLTGAEGFPKPWIAAAMLQFDPARQNLIADKVLPELGVNWRQGTIPIIQREDYLRRLDTRMGDGAAYKRGKLRVKNLPFYCQKFGHEGPVTQEDQAFFAQVFDAELMTAKRERGVMELDREYRVASALFNTSVWTGSTLYADVSSSAPWGVNTSPVIEQITSWARQMQLNTGYYPNGIILPTPCLDALTVNAELRNRFPYVSLITKQMVINDFAKVIHPSLKYVFEANAVVNTASEGLPNSGSYLWDTNYIMLVRVAETQDPAEPCLGRTLRWNAMDMTGLEVFGYPEPQTDSNIVKVRNYLDELIIDEGFAFLAKVGPSVTTTT